MSTGIISWIRTVVPVLVGSLVAWLVTLGVHLDKGTENALVVALTGLFTAGYYTLARLLEKKFPQAGVLLGVAQTPDSYSKGTLPVVEDVPALNVVAEDIQPTVEEGVASVPVSENPIFDDLVKNTVTTL